MSDAVSVIRARLPNAAPKLGLVLGSGLGGLVDEIDDAVRISYTDLPHFPDSTVSRPCCRPGDRQACRC
jgi:purine-nucleoside phosphorylase